MAKGGNSELKDSKKTKQSMTSWMLWSVLVPVFIIACQFFLNTYLEIPLGRLVRNVFMEPTPPPVIGKYECSKESLVEDVTIVVTVKDACSQAPGFLKALHNIVPSSVHIIYTFPNFSSCATIEGMELDTWDKVTLLPLPLRVSPMRGWVDAVPYIETPYSLLLHNDGYALDPFFACELVGALKAWNQSGDGHFVAAAPMLYESKADKSLAAHASQSNLRLVRENGGVTVRHDHSVAKALNRGYDFEEGPQTEFLEDHGFLIETDKISAVIDPHASYTLEYIDMIMTIRSNLWQVLFVPTARLEFRITEFSWRDIPYFMYKRSEITCQGTRDYLAQKWKANFPNTGFWTYIKYTIVEQHVYERDTLSGLPQKDKSAIILGFFQMAGFNRYRVEGEELDFIDMLNRIEAGNEDGFQNITVLRRTERTTWATSEVRTTKLPITEILPTVNPSSVRIDADMPLEYLPFAMAEFRFPGEKIPKAKLEELCGLVVKHSDSVSCWVNLPTFKSNGFLIRVLDRVAAMLKLPSRVTTYIELFTGSTRNAMDHLEPLRTNLAERHPELEVNLVACDHRELCPLALDISGVELFRFAGRPPSVPEVLAAID